LSTYYVEKETKFVLDRVAQIKRWKYTEFLNFLADLFANSLDMINDPNVSVDELRERYEGWQLAVLPYGGADSNE